MMTKTVNKKELYVVKTGIAAALAFTIALMAAPLAGVIWERTSYVFEFGKNVPWACFCAGVAAIMYAAKGR